MSRPYRGVYTRVADVVLDNVTKVYVSGRQRRTAVDSFSLNVADKEFIVLVGPSGCGKTSTLRMVAGLEEVTQGTIRIGGQVVNDVEPKNRDIAMVFQNYALYPHMTVYKNMAFALKLRRVPRRQIDRKVRETASLLGIEDLLDRKPRELSGGQRQRVAVGRAIVRAPRAFLFDEPLSNLDAQLRVEMRLELKKLQRRLETTTIYVTHDQEEAMTLGDRVVVMKDGRVQQCGAPLEVYDRPANRFVAGFVGTPPMNFFDGCVIESDGAFVFEFCERRLSLAAERVPGLAGLVGRRLVLGVRPEAISFLPPPESGAAVCRECGARLHGPFCHACGCENADASEGGTAGVFEARVMVVEPLGDESDVYLRLPGGEHAVARVKAHASVREGSSVRVFIDPYRVHLFEPGDAGGNLTLTGNGAVSRAG